MEKPSEEFGEEIVHIIPLGHEIDRAVVPFERYKANKVYLLAVTERPKDSKTKYSDKLIEEQRCYLEIVRNKLKERGIEVVHRNVDMFDLLEVIKNVSNVILEEKTKNNTVFVNISGAGRLTSVGATLAAMAHGAKAYYVGADEYSESEEDKKKHGLSICRKLKLQFLEKLQLQLPKNTEMKILVKLCEEQKEMKTIDILKFLRAEKVEGFEEEYLRLRRTERSNYLMKLNKGILEKLEASGYVTRERRGKCNIIKITKAGIYVAHISGLLK